MQSLEKVGVFSFSGTNGVCIPSSEEYLSRDKISEVFNFSFLEPGRNTARLQYAVSEIPKLKGLNSRGGTTRRDVFKWIFEETVRPLYNKIPYSLENGVSLATLVADGLGDFFGMIQIAKAIAEIHPINSLSLTAVFDNLKHQNKAEMSLEKIASFFSERNIELKTNFLINENDFVINDLFHSSLVITGPVILWYNRNIKKLNYINFREYSNDIDSSLTNKEMGFSPYSMGVHFPQPSANANMMNIQNETLKGILFGDANPSSSDVENYKRETSLFFSYAPVKNFLQFYMTFVSSFSNQSGQMKCDIICPFTNVQLYRLFLDWSYEFDLEPTFKEYPQFKEFLITQGVSKITLITKDLNESHIQLSDRDGCELRLIDPFPLSNEDFSILLANAKRAMGGTGDLSLSEILALESPPFYCALGHKSSMMELMLKCYLGTQEVQEDDKIVLYLKMMSIASRFDWHKDVPSSELGIFYLDELMPILGLEGSSRYVDRFEFMFKIIEKLTSLSLDPQFHQEWRDFTVFLKNNFNFKDILREEIAHTMALSNNAELAEETARVQESFLNGQISLEDAYHTLKEKIQPYSTLD